MHERTTGKTQVQAAAKAGLSERSGRRIERAGGEHVRQPRQWRTRDDPFATVWDEIAEQLAQQPSLQALTLLEWQQGPINSPTVFNSSMNLAQFWDGRAADLQEQAAGPIANPKEMAFTHVLAIDVLNSIPDYVRKFQLIFADSEINIERVTDAIAEFEKTLVTPGSRFDRWLLDDADALSENELAGYALFKQSGCVACHNGTAVGDNTYQKMGLLEPYQTDNPATGRAAVTGKDADRFMFKVPTLRNVELTYPYLHDGAAATLEQAVDIMGRIQLGKTFTAEENAKIVAFLRTLTGERPQITLPRLPPSTPATPRPQPFD